MRESKNRLFARYFTAAFFVVAGLLHFTNAQFYLGIMPRFLPHPLELVYLSGGCEMLGGIGLLIPQLRQFAGYGLILLLLAVLPANVTMFTNSIHQQGLSVATVLLALRIPFQLVFILVVKWVAAD
jgi:uncharacterized membrane protein